SQKDRNTGRTTPTPIVVAGIAGGKAYLDAHLLDTGLDCRYANTKSGRRALCNRLRKHRVTRAVFEPTGRYHRQLHQCLAAAGLQTVLVNPLRSRRFAAALGQLANNDRVDATMLARFGRLADLQATPPQAANLQLLQDLLVARRKLVAQLGTLRKLTAALNPQAAHRLTKPLASLQAARTACDRDLQTCLAADAVLARRAEIIQSIPGCGPLNAACLCAAMPELGSLGRRPAAALLGLAPFDRDSGQRRGARSIRGGRAQPRHLLYMAALSATRCQPAAQACYQRLVANGKSHKLALVAVLRRLAGLLDTLLRQDRLWQPAPPAHPAEVVV
ncbi:MAG: IS110 family transposase, partial [Bryobacterales bacterium]|nr:IS110 family transposase [Bryobacterales bacterium]